jgi:thioredoxin reductase (NADPH)
MVTQAEKFGARLIFKNVTKVNLSEKPFEKPHEVWVDDELYRSRAVILATGARPRKLGVPGEERLWGKGVSSCATCDGAFYKEKQVAVVGGGDSAMEEAVFLTRFAKKVYVIHRRKELRASQIMQERAKKNERIEFVYNTVVSEILGDEKVEGVKVKDNETGIESEIEIDGFFLAIGYIPETELFKDFVTVDDKGYAEPKSRTMSEIPGVFIAGDVEDAVYRQAITAAADGCKAALDAERWLMEA